MPNFDSTPGHNLPRNHFGDGDIDSPDSEPDDGHVVDGPDAPAPVLESPDYPDDADSYVVDAPESPAPDLSVPQDEGPGVDETQPWEPHLALDREAGAEVTVTPVRGLQNTPSPDQGGDTSLNLSGDAGNDADQDVAVHAHLDGARPEGGDTAEELIGPQTADFQEEAPEARTPGQEAGYTSLPLLIAFNSIARLTLSHDPPLDQEAVPSPEDTGATVDGSVTGIPPEADRLSEASMDEATLAFSRQRTEDAFLHFVDVQRERTAAGDFSAFASATQDTLFQTFVESPYFTAAYDEAVRRTVVSNNEGNLVRRIRGIFFEQLAYAFTAAMGADSGDVVLSPDQTFELVTYANPDQKLQREGGRLRHYPGVNVPDGLVVSPEGVITGVLEYTLSKSARKIQPQAAAVATMSPALKAISRDPSFWIAGPHTSAQTVKTEVILPCSHDEFDTFFRYVYEMHRVDEDHATLREMQAYARHTKARYPELNQRVREELRREALAELDVNVVLLDSKGRLRRP